MLHVHVASGQAAPYRVMATGVWAPYPIDMNPHAVVEQTIESFTRWVERGAPQIAAGQQPEDVAMMANTIATAKASGHKIPKYVDRRLVAAADMIIAGKPFQITSAGRTISVQPKAEVAAAMVPSSEPVTINVR